MTRISSNREGLSKADQKFLSDIEAYGWNVTNVLKREGESEEGPDWSFSCGLFHTFQHPEIVIFGLPAQAMIGIVNEIGSQVKAGATFDAGKEYDSILDGYPCAFRTFPEEQYKDYLGWAVWFYQEDFFPALQCFWPDKNRLYPWQSGCDPGIRRAQPLFSKPS